MSEPTTKQTKNDTNSKKNLSSNEDDDENQVEKPLLDTVPKTEIKQPKKKKMPLFKKKPAADETAAGGGDSSMFDMKLEQLSELMEVRGKDLMEKLDSSDYNGVKGILEKLKVDGNKGLDSNNEQDLEQRRIAYGKNEIPPKPMKSFIRLCWDAFHDMLLVILLICSVVSIGLSFYKPPQQSQNEQDDNNLEWIEGVAILAAVLVVVFVTAFNDWRKERQFRGLQDRIEKDHQTSVIRDNHVQQIPVTELVVGDLCFIKYGDIIPADGLVVQASDLKIDESSITGETDLVKKSEKEDVGLLSGTQVMEGSGRMVVVGVGLNSQVGRIMNLLGATEDDKKKGKKGKKGKKKGKKKDKKDGKKKDKKPKPKSSTKVSPDTSKPDENEDNVQTVHIEHETKPHPRIRKLPPLQQSNKDEHEMKPTKTENYNKNEQKKESSSSKSSDHEQKKKESSSSESSNTEPEKKPNKDENQKKEQKKKSIEPKTNDELKKKESSSSESSNNEPEKKSNNDEKQKKKSTKPPTNNEQEEKKSSSSESSVNEPKKKPNNTENQNEEQKKKSIKPRTNDEEQKKESSSSESSDDQHEEKKSSSSKSSINESKKKSNNTEKQNEEQKKKSTKPRTNDGDQKKESSSSESSDEEQEKKSEVTKQKQSNNRPTTTSSIAPKVSDADKKDSKKKEKNGNDPKEDPEKKPAGLAALAQDAENSDDEEDGGSKDAKHKSVLQTKLTKLALYIGYIGMTAAVLTLICLIIRFCITTYVINQQPAQASDVSYFISYLIQAITVVVVSVPEGLPLAVTLALAYAVRKMMTDNNLVRHLDACETMGNASTICSDKTGTLTTNRMTVVQCYITGKHHDKLPKKEEINKDLLPLLFEAITVNSNYTSKIEKEKNDEGLPKQIGNKTECALLGLINEWGGSYDEIRKEIPQDKLVKVYTFNSARKTMSTIIQRDEGYRVYTKGASEMVLNNCKSIIGEDNKPKDLNDNEKKKITNDIIDKMANDGLRTICIAYRDLGKDKQNWDDEEKIIKDLICIAIVGIEDPVRKEVPEAIEKCQKAGVVVRMVTGDNITTARSIATKCGIIKPEDDFLVLEGKEFNKQIRDSSGKISQKKLDEIWPKLRVLARSSPTDKYNLVNGIVESQTTDHREVVAVTGDGTNDGPALKRADVGFAMGIQGTDVAKQASDIILTDDNFSSIVKAMMWGRNIYDCIAKFLQFQLTANLSAGVISVVSAAAISSVPLRAVQMLWVNLIMDTLASLALATEPPTEALLNRKPYGRTQSIISPLMMRNILGQSFYQLLIMLIILYVGQNFLNVQSTVIQLQTEPDAGRQPSEQFTMVFNAFVLMTLFNEINSRKLHGERNVFEGIFRNPFFYCIWSGCFAAQILIVTFGGNVFSCSRLNIIQWLWCLLFGVGSLIWQQILLFIPIKPFSKCFSTLYRVCCPCLYKRKKKDEEEKGEDRKSDKKTKKKPSKKKDDDKDIGDEDEDRETRAMRKYGTIVALTNATVVAQPPPIFARYMLRKSVDRLNTEFRVINEFRSRLEKIKDNKLEETRNSQKEEEDSLDE